MTFTATAAVAYNIVVSFATTLTFSFLTSLIMVRFTKPFSQFLTQN